MSHFILILTRIHQKMSKFLLYKIQISRIVRNLSGEQEGKQLNKLLYLGVNVLSKDSANWGQHKESENIHQLL